MIKTSAKKMAEKTAYEIFDDLENWIEDVETKYEKDSARAKIAKARTLWVEGKHDSSVNLLDEIEVILKNQEDKDFCGLVIEILRTKK